jgi:hypothetical protein
MPFLVLQYMVVLFKVKPLCGRKETMKHWLFIFIASALALNSCFSPWQGEAGDTLLDIVLPGGSDSRVMVTDPEKNGMRYEITLSGPGGTIERTLSGGQNRLTEKVMPGNWNISVRAYADTKDPAVTAVHRDGQLRGMVNTSVTVSSGQSGLVAVELKTVTGVKDWAELTAAMGTGANDGDYVILERDIPYSSSITVTRNITLIADGDKMIYRGGTFGAFFNVTSGKTLTLGSSLDTGSLTLKGSSGAADELLTINGASSKVVMNDNVFITENVTSAILLYGGTFEMNGGRIFDNSANTGGAIYINGGTFTMNGGTISGNIANSGGGVYIGGGTFKIVGGEISGNTATNGGGVYVNSGNLNLVQGKIRNNTAQDTGTGPANGGGLYIGASAVVNTTGLVDFEISGNSVIVGNAGTSIGHGGGIYSASSFTLPSGFVVRGNTISAVIPGSGAARGGGIYLASGVTLTLNGTAVIFNNSINAPSTFQGSGIYKAGTATTNATTSNVYDNKTNESILTNQIE